MIGFKFRVKMTQLFAIASVSIALGSGIASCSRRSAENDALILGRLHKWNAEAQGRESEINRDEQYMLLPEAAQTGDLNIVKTALARGPNRRTLNQALLMAARSEPLVIGYGGQEEAERRYTAIARLLLEKGAGIEARDEGGSTPLISAAGNGDTALVKLLLEKGAAIEATNSFSQTPLISAACMCPSVDMPETDNVVRLLLDMGANIEATDKEGGTALLAAASWGRDTILKILLDRGANIEARDNKGNTALLISAAGNAYPTGNAVQVLLARGGDIAATNNNGDTALILAATNGGFEDLGIVRMLLSGGADVHARNNKGRTALDSAVQNGRSAIVPVLRAAMAKSR